MTRRTLPVRRLAVAAITPFALVTLAACGGDDASSAEDTSASTSPDSSDTASAEPTDDEAAAGEEIEPAAFMDTFKAAFDGGTAHLVMSSEGGAAGFEAEGDADFSQTPPDMTFTMGGAVAQGQEITAIMVDGVMYMQMPTTGEKYIKFDLTDPNNPLGSGLTDQLDPRAMFENFEKSIGSVVAEGEQEIDGETVDAYSVTVDSAAVIEGSGQEMPPGVDLPEEITYNMFLDEDGNFRRMAFSMGESVGSITMDLTDWGKDVSIEAPPADQVTDMAGAMGGSTAG